MSKVIGIDLGTTNSAVAVLEGTESKIITNPEGNCTAAASDRSLSVIFGLLLCEKLQKAAYLAS